MNKVRESSELNWSREKELDSSRIKGMDVSLGEMRT